MVPRICRIESCQDLQAQIPGLGKTWGYPIVDVFAGPNPEDHSANLVHTKFRCPGSLGTDALCHDWLSSFSCLWNALFTGFPTFYLFTLFLMQFGSC